MRKVGRVRVIATTIVVLALLSAVGSPLYGGWLLEHSPRVASPATGEVVQTVFSSRRGDSPAFFITPVENALWWVLSVLMWVPLAATAVIYAWMVRPGWRKQ